jgi:glycosyltransferase involved in cell wall biosynthesis
MKNLKVLWFNWRCWLNPAMGGAEVFTREIAKRWVEAGNEVTLFTSEFPGCKKEEVSDGVKIVRAGGRFSVYLQARRFYAKRFSKEGFDVVIDEINTVPFFAHKFVKNSEKVVALIHQLAREYWFYETPFPLSYLGYSLENRWLRNYTNIPTVTVSNSTRKDLSILGFNRVFVVPEGLNFKPLNNIEKKDSIPVIVFAGRLKRAKRPDHAVKAFAYIKEKIPAAELWVLGDGPFKNELERISCDGVRFFGHLSSTERRALIKRSWVLVNPSVREGWGLNVTEAGALGVPSVAYDVPGLRDSIKDGQTGLLVESGDIMGLASGILTVLSDEGLRTELSKNALSFSCNFSWDETARIFLEVATNDKPYENT